MRGPVYNVGMQKRVFVGLSGGVDSAVSAALLRQEGYDVVGAFIKIWRPEFTECTWREDRIDAMRVCAALKIPYREIDLSEEYKRTVVDAMLSDYARGITPNPDVLCNREIKFGAFMRWARESGADLVATGHYARILESNGQYHLARSKDTAKDQSYFLHRLDARDLSSIRFPVGGMLKSEVRDLALKFDLPVAHKRDSQGLCFIGAVSMEEFLSRYIPLEAGEVVDEFGAKIGTHSGAGLYTIGQRHGFVATGGAVRYVTNIDIERNIIRVSTSRRDAMRTLIGIRNLHWINGTFNLPRLVLAQARYRESPVEASVVSASAVTFAEPHIAAPGQSIVFYEGDVCLGGAIIE